MFTRDSLIREQKADPILVGLARNALSVADSENVAECYYIKSGILMRKWRPPRSPSNEEWRIVHQIVVPLSYRGEILSLAHDLPLAGHLGIRKTKLG